jgi:hypothetical protein
VTTARVLVLALVLAGCGAAHHHAARHAPATSSTPPAGWDSSEFEGMVGTYVGPEGEIDANLALAIDDYLTATASQGESGSVDSCAGVGPYAFRRTVYVFDCSGTVYSVTGSSLTVKYRVRLDHGWRIVYVAWRPAG